jgi:hypothetical protein
VLLTRAPLRPKPSFDLHVLGMPPAFVLSQDQTLRLNFRSMPFDTNQSPASIRLHTSLGLPRMLRLNVAYQLHAAACASLPFPTMSNNRSAFLCLPTTRSGRRRRQRRQAFTLYSEPGQSLFCILSFLFSSLLSTPVRGFRSEGPGEFSLVGNEPQNRVGLVLIPGFLRRRLAFRWAPSSREAAYTSAR